MIVEAFRRKRVVRFQKFLLSSLGANPVFEPITQLIRKQTRYFSNSPLESKKADLAY